MRITLIILLPVVAGLLSACPGSVAMHLPVGSGQGDYIGQFLDDTGTLVLGTFEMEIADSGAMEGDGQLNGRDMKLVGFFDGSRLEGWVSDDLTGRTGQFDGAPEGNNMLGSYELEGPAGERLEGFWDANPDN
ncbi:MAG: hypothetical protein R3F46_04070 [bacterium]